MPQIDSSATRLQERAPRLLSIDEVNQLYPWEWVLLKVTSIDDQGLITHGEVLGHTRYRSKLNKAVARMHEHDPDAHIFIFLGGTRYASGEDLRRALDEAPERIS